MGRRQLHFFFSGLCACYLVLLSKDILPYSSLLWFRGSLSWLLLPLEACMEKFGSMKGTPQGRGQFQHGGLILFLEYILFSSIVILIPSLWVGQVKLQKPIMCWDSLGQL